MSDIESVMNENRAAVEELAAASERCGATWTTPRAPGKWSPSQVVEHVARSLEDSAKSVNGQPNRLPTLPSFLRPAVRSLFLKRVLKTGRFGKARTNRAMDPVDGPATPAEGRVRLEAAMRSYEQACLQRSRTSTTFASGVFGNVSLVDYGRFQVLHTLHHRRQLPA
jgi:hypothetical protein